MKFLVVAFALICAVAARPQFGGPGGFGGQGFGGGPGFGGGFGQPSFGGSSSNAAAGTQSFK